MRASLVSKGALMYEEYARVYDQSGQFAFSLKMIPYLGRLIERHPIVCVPAKNTMVDLACGTGTVAIGLAQDGWRVYAVDVSAQMLAQARAKVTSDDLDLYWSQQDMRRLVLPERVHLATCLYDSMNYMLTSDDLLASFRRVFDALLPGGLLLFDMNTAWAFASLWDDETYFTDSDELSVIIRGAYDSRRQQASVVVTCFQRMGDLYRKIVERHTEQAYPPEQIATLLSDVGFHVEADYDCFSFERPSPNTPRIMWVARRPKAIAGSHR